MPQSGAMRSVERGRRSAGGAALALALALAAHALPGGALADASRPLVDRVAVVVEGPSARDRVPQVATLWDLFVVAGIRAIREYGPSAPAAPPDADAIRDAQHEVVELLVALREAVHLGRDTAPVELVDEARDALAAQIGGHDALRAFLRERSISIDFLDMALRREVIVGRFTRDSVRLSVPDQRTTTNERFEQGGHPFEGLVFEDVEEEFAAWLRARQFEEQRRLWLVDLRSRCRLQIFDVSEDLVP